LSGEPAAASRLPFPMKTETAAMLRKLIPRLGSDQPGEILATVAAIGRVLCAAGCDWHDLADVLLADALAKAKTRRRS
jgi:hypothetical protein